MSLEDRIDSVEQDLADFYGSLYGRKFDVKTIREWLEERGYRPPGHPGDVSFELRSLVEHLSDLGVIIEWADHLNDDELYAWLLEQLGAQMFVMPDSFLHTSPIGGCSEEDNDVWLAYYATDEDRADWKTRFPDYELPPKLEAPHKRDFYAGQYER
jgi:hypothetical protein